MQTTKLKIDGMSCQNCVRHVQKALQAVPGVASATVTLTEGAVVEHEGVSIQDLQRAVAGAGEYRAETVA